MKFFFECDWGVFSLGFAVGLTDDGGVVFAVGPFVFGVDWSE